jgi:hypothetical protein
MFRITTQTCRAFPFAKVLIMAAVNIENAPETSKPSLGSAGNPKDKDYEFKSL